MVILVLTLTPHPGARTLSWSFCILCGSFGTANLIRNVILFVPLGIGAGMVVGMGLGTGSGSGSGARAAEGDPAHPTATRRFLRAWLPAVALTAGVELAQIFIAGRNSLLADFVANAAGAALGIVLVGSFVRGARGRAGTAAGPSPRGVVQALGWWGLSATVLAGTALAFRLAPPPPPQFVQIQADLAQYERYTGTVHEVWLSGGAAGGSRERLETGRHPDPVALVDRIFGGSRVVVAFETGPPPARTAPLFSVFTGAQREVIVLGVAGEDAVLRLPYLATTLRLDRPDTRIRGAFGGMETGDPGELSFWLSTEGTDGPGDGSACLRLARGAEGRDGVEAERCGLRPTLGQGWTLLLYPTRFPPWLRSAIAWGWLLGLGFVPGLVARSRRAAGLAGLGLVVVGGSAPWLLGSAAILPVGQGLALLAGVLLGWWGRSGLVAFVPAPVSPGPDPGPDPDPRR
ncbi:MAG: VanZ family protein [Gemmatimonadales bacterium]|nr:MAG: VanZ family protein [Gemmatimonadales bacterium]